MYALYWKLLIIGLLSEYFVTLLKRQYLKKIAAKCSIFLHQVYFFLWEGQGYFLEIRIQFLLGRAKGRGKRELGEKPQMRCFWQNSPLLSKIQTLSHKLFIRQTSNHPHCDHHAKKPICKNFQVILSSSSWS